MAQLKAKMEADALKHDEEMKQMREFYDGQLKVVYGKLNAQTEFMKDVHEDLWNVEEALMQVR